MDTKALRQRILDLAIHGKLVPQDPNDEPAAELLKRINPKAEISSDNELYGKVPEGWCICKLKDVCSKIVDGDHNPPKGKSNRTEYLMLSAQNIINENIFYTCGVRFLDKDDFELCNKRTNVIQGDILLTIVGTVGRTCIFNGEKNITLQRSVACLTSLVYNKYLKFYMDSPLVQCFMIDNAKGTAQKGFYLKQLEQLSIVIPPLPEQHRIVAKIESLFSLISLIETGKSNLQTAVKQAKSKILDLAIHGKLVPQDPNDEPAAELLKRINPKAEISSDNELYGKVPEGWCICKLKDVCSKIVDGDHNPPKGKSNRTEYLMLSAQNIINENIFYTCGVRFLDKDDFELCNKRTNVIQGDILLTIVGTVGRTCIFNGEKNITLQRSVACLTSLVYNKYLKFYMDSPLVQCFMIDNAKGTAQKGFYLKQLEQLSIVIPPLPEQRRIVAKIESLFTQLDLIEASL